LIFKASQAMRILIVEDDPIIALAAEFTLTEAGHEVFGPFVSEQSALAAAADLKPDVALVDIDLAGQPEGPGIARSLRDQYGVRSLFASGQPRTARANKDAAMGLLHKPYSDADLADAIPVLQTLLDGGSPPPPKIPRGLELF
jgi:two-component system, response regulator PdtaR